MLVSRHRIGKYLPEVVHQGPDPAAVAVCREVLAESGAECVILHGSRGWGGWDEQSDLNVIVIHHAAGDEVERERLCGEGGPGQGAPLPGFFRLQGGPGIRAGHSDAGELRGPEENAEP